MNKESIVYIIIGLAVAVAIAGFAMFMAPSSTPSPIKSGSTVTPTPIITPTVTPSATPAETPTPKSGNITDMTVDKNKKYSATMKTSEGEIVIDLNVAQTPIAAGNFITLANKGFYNNTIFHRVIKGFMIQGGDPKGDGTGGPGYKFDDESFTGEYTRGTIAMANSGPNTNGSQFFIMHQDYPLPKNYVIFGKVTSGLEVVDKIATAPVKSGPSGESSTPVNPVKVLSVEIGEK